MHGHNRQRRVLSEVVDAVVRLSGLGRMAEPHPCNQPCADVTSGWWRLTTLDKTVINLAVVLHLQAELGEGLHWNVDRGCLWCVDITGRRIMNWQRTEPAHREWLLPQRVGWVIPLLG